MKKSQLQEFIRQCIREVIAEAEATPEVPKSVEDADSEMTKLAKLVKKMPDELKSKIIKKIKTAQSDIDSYKDSLKPKEDAK